MGGDAGEGEVGWRYRGAVHETSRGSWHTWPGDTTIEGRDKPRWLGRAEAARALRPRLPRTPQVPLCRHIHQTRKQVPGTCTLGEGEGGEGAKSRADRTLSLVGSLWPNLTPSGRTLHRLPIPAASGDVRQGGRAHRGYTRLSFREGLGCRSAEWLAAPVDVRVQQLRRGYLGGGRSRCCLVRPG